jgi:hypothetical protein
MPAEAAGTCWLKITVALLDRPPQARDSIRIGVAAPR